MAKVQFKAKVETIYNMDDSPAWQQIKVPKLASRHCDMHAFRTSREYGSFANSDMFPAILARAARQAGIGEYIRLDRPLPDCVTVDQSGFLATVAIEL